MNTRSISQKAPLHCAHLHNHIPTSLSNNEDKQGRVTSKINNARHSKDVIQFPVRAKTAKQGIKGWICNISKRYVFSQHHHEYLQIEAKSNHSQFNIICKLLDANTCSVIYFDEQLTPQQLAFIRQHHSHSRTELLHAKVAFMFAKKVSSLYA